VAQGSMVSMISHPRFRAAGVWHWMRDSVNTPSQSSFSRSGRGAKYLCGGWSDPEEWGVWTMQHLAHMLFNCRDFLNQDVLLKAIISAFCPEQFPSTTTEVVVNGHQLCVWRVGNEPQAFEVLIPAALLQRASLHVVFRILDPRSPVTVGFSADDRLLGVGLHQLEFSRFKSTLEDA
jgi:hypothetical protein